MGITSDEIYVCDYCGEDNGKFDSDTGNHPVCAENAELRKQIQALTAERDALLARVDALETGITNAIQELAVGMGEWACVNPPYLPADMEVMHDACNTLSDLFEPTPQPPAATQPETPALSEYAQKMVTGAPKSSGLQGRK